MQATCCGLLIGWKYNAALRSIQSIKQTGEESSRGRYIRLDFEGSAGRLQAFYLAAFESAYAIDASPQLSFYT
jgi:hypothetical protein